MTMQQNSMVCIIREQTQRALWEVKNVMDCVPDSSWNKLYCEMPLWKHIYHMLHSLDLWYMNPRDINYCEPNFHEEGLNNLNIISHKQCSRKDMNLYYQKIKHKIECYVIRLTENDLLQYPENCEYTIFTLILAQFRHLHTHMGIAMGFIIDDTGSWPRVLGLETPIPTNNNYEKFF